MRVSPLLRSANRVPPGGFVRIVPRLWIHRTWAKPFCDRSLPEHSLPFPAATAPFQSPALQPHLSASLTHAEFALLVCGLSDPVVEPSALPLLSAMLRLCHVASAARPVQLTALTLTASTAHSRRTTASLLAHSLHTASRRAAPSTRRHHLPVRRFATLPSSSSPLPPPLPRPPPSPAADSAYSSLGLNADSSFSSASAVPALQRAPPSRMITPAGVESVNTWTAESSSQLGSPGRIMIYASEVAGLVGLNPYKSISELFESVWARTEPEAYAHRISQVEAETGVKLLTKDQEAEAVLKDHSAISQLLSECLSNLESKGQEDITAAKETLQAAAKSLQTGPTPITAEQSAIVSDYLVGNLSKAYGTVNESAAIEMYERVAAVRVIDNNRLFYGREIGECNIQPEEIQRMEQMAKAAAEATEAAAVAAATAKGVTAQEASSPSSAPSVSALPLPDLSTVNDPTPLLLHRSIWVGGRVDGFTAAPSGESHLVEIKNRTRKFLSPLPLYDRCQMEVYLQVCEYERGELVERLRKRVDEQEAAESIASVKASEERAARDKAERDAEQALFAAIVSEDLPPRLAENSEADLTDDSFLASSNEAAVAEPAASEPESDSFDDSSAIVSEEFDSDFLADLSASVTNAEVEEDASFLASTEETPRPALNSEESDRDHVLDGSAESAAALPRPSPLVSTPSSPAFEIVGTEHVVAARSMFRFVGSGMDAASVGAQSITHVLIRESAAGTREDVASAVDDARTKQLDDAFLLDSAAVASAADDDCDADGDGRRVSAGELDQQFMREPLLDEPERMEDAIRGRTLEDTFASPLLPPEDSEEHDAAASFSSNPAAAAPAAAPSPPVVRPTLFLDQFKRTPLRRDSRVWNEKILPGILRFSEFLTKFLAVPELQRRYLLCRSVEEKEAILAEIKPIVVRRQFDFAANYTRRRKQAELWNNDDEAKQHARITDTSAAENGSIESPPPVAKSKSKKTKAPASPPASASDEEPAAKTKPKSKRAPKSKAASSPTEVLSH